MTVLPAVHLMLAMASGQTLDVTATGATSSRLEVLRDTVVIRVSDRAVWGEAVRLVEELRIGTIAGEPEYVIGSLGDVHVKDDGQIWIADRQLAAIRRFDEEGRFIDQIGRRGQGPGEFVYPTSMASLPDGSVAVWDDGQIRVSIFDTEGKFVDSFRPPAFMLRGVLESLVADREGYLYLLSSNFARHPRGPRVTFWLKMHASGDIIDSVMAEPFDEEGSVDVIHTITGISPLGYRVVGRNTRYALHLEVRDDSIIRLERNWEAIPYAEEERREKQRLEELFATRRGRSARRIPSHKPVFSEFKIDRAGRLWIQIYAPGYRESESAAERRAREEACEFFGLRNCGAGAREWRQRVVYEVIKPNGQYMGRITLPNQRSVLEAAHGNSIWVAETGRFGEEYVVRYRIMATS